MSEEQTQTLPPPPPAEEQEAIVASGAPSIPSEPKPKLPTEGAPSSAEGSQPQAGAPELKQDASGAFVIKVDNREVSLTPDQARIYAQLGVASQMRFAQAARKEAAAQTLLNTLTNDPDWKKRSQVLQESFVAEARGDRVRGQRLYHDFLTKHLAELLREMNLPEDERARREATAALDARARDLESREALIRQSQAERDAAEVEARLQRETPEAAKKAGLPHDAATEEGRVALADVMAMALSYEQAGVTDYTLEQAAQEVALRRTMAGSSYADTLDGAKVKEKHPTLYKRVVDHYIRGIRAHGASTPTSATPPRQDAEEGRSGQEPKRELPSEIRARILARARMTE